MFFVLLAVGYSIGHKPPSPSMSLSQAWAKLKAHINDVLGSSYLADVQVLFDEEGLKNDDWQLSHTGGLLPAAWSLQHRIWL